MKSLIAASLSLLLIGCNANDTSLKKGIAWGMSMNQVRSHYKTDPNDKGSDILEFKENFYRPEGGQVEPRYRYRFDSQKGLVSYNILAYGQDQEEKEALFAFARSTTSDIGGVVVEQEEDYPEGEPVSGGGFLPEGRVVSDKLYKSNRNEAIRILLERNRLFGGKDSTFVLTISCLSPGRNFQETPSSHRSKHEMPTKKD